MIRVWNLSDYPGFRLNQSIYTPFNNEREHVLPQDMMVWIYGLEEVEVNNFSLKKFNEKTITIIYLDAFNYWLLSAK